jgi:hypothetical protein
MRLSATPLLLFLATKVSQDIEYSSLYQPILIGVILAVIGQLMEIKLYETRLLWLCLAIDFTAAIGIIYLSQFIFTNAFITPKAALMTAVIFFLSEYFQIS